MKRYTIIHTETLVGHYDVEAENEDEAFKAFCRMVGNGEIDFSDLELVASDNEVKKED